MLHTVIASKGIARSLRHRACFDGLLEELFFQSVTASDGAGLVEHWPALDRPAERAWLGWNHVCGGLF